MKEFFILRLRQYENKLVTIQLVVVSNAGQTQEKW